MSETKHVKGILNPVNTEIDQNELAKSIISESYPELLDYSSDTYSYLEVLNDEQSHYLVLNDTIYKDSYKELDPDDDIYKAEVKPDGSIEYEVKWHNGGACKMEVIDKAVEIFMKGLK